MRAGVILRAAGLGAALLVAGGCGDAGAPEPPVPSAPAPESGGGTHDHSSRHGGVVGMAGDLHLEAVATPEGRVRVYLTDRWRRPLAPTDWTGEVTLHLREGARRFALRAVGEALEATGPPLAVDEVETTVALARGGQPIEMDFLVPVGTAARAVLPAACLPPHGPAPAGARAPRCEMLLPRRVSALAVTPDGGTVLLAALGHGVTLWRTANGAFAGLLPAGASADPDHVHPVDALALRADGEVLAVSLDGDLQLVTFPDGRPLATFPGTRVALLPAVAWTAAGDLVTSALWDGTAKVRRPSDGHELWRFTVEDEALALAVAPDGRAAALAGVRGPIALLDLDRRGSLGERDAPADAGRVLILTATHLVAGDARGVVRVWERATAGPAQAVATHSPVQALAADSDGRLVAVGHDDGGIRLVRLADGAVVATLARHTTGVVHLAWAGPTLVSVDALGLVAFWDPADRG